VADHPHPKTHQAALTEWRLLATERSQHQLPAPVILCRIDRGSVAQSFVPLQQQHHRQHRRRTRVLPSRLVRLDEGLLESVLDNSRRISQRNR